MELLTLIIIIGGGYLLIKHFPFLIVLIAIVIGIDCS